MQMFLLEVMMKQSASIRKGVFDIDTILLKLIEDGLTRTLAE